MNRAMGSSLQGITSLGREAEGCTTLERTNSGISITDPGQSTMVHRGWISTRSCGHSTLLSSAEETSGEEASGGLHPGQEIGSYQDPRKTPQNTPLEIESRCHLFTKPVCTGDLFTKQLTGLNLQRSDSCELAHCARDSSQWRMGCFPKLLTLPFCPQAFRCPLPCPDNERLDNYCGEKWQKGGRGSVDTGRPPSGQCHWPPFLHRILSLSHPPHHSALLSWETTGP